VKENGESNLITLICSSTLLMSESRDSESFFWMERSVWWALVRGSPLLDKGGLESVPDQDGVILAVPP
jgi:hypothetical protein